MNKKIRQITEDLMLNSLHLCTKKQIDFFMRMYGKKNVIPTLEEVVHYMSDDKLDWAFSQIENTLQKNRNSFYTSNSAFDIDVLHDIIFDARNMDASEDEVIKVWLELPRDIQLDIEQFGMSDTPTKERIYVHLTNN